MNGKFKAIGCGIGSAAVFRGLLGDEVISGLWQLLDGGCGDVSVNVCSYSDFVAKLYKNGADLSEYVLKAVLEDENFYIAGKAAGKKFDPLIEKAVENELKVFQELSQVTPSEIRAELGYGGFLPEWKNTEFDFAEEYKKRIENVGQCGYGKFARNRMFILRNGGIVPVKHPDKQSLSALFGYERERKAVIDNTLTLLSGKPTQNVLLYGDAGTGKSSTVKAVVNEFADRGLRLIEITKEQLGDIPDIIESISANPLKFIIFIDDLSFSADEDRFGALKAALEGSVSARSDNAAVYATSNRRHLVKESFSLREGDDIHRNDTIQETISLSARFGLTIGFYRPDKAKYLEIVGKLAKAAGIDAEKNALELKAESFAMKCGGRSGRTAEQFINSLRSERAKKTDACS